MKLIKLLNPGRAWLLGLLELLLAGAAGPALAQRAAVPPARRLAKVAAAPVAAAAVVPTVPVWLPADAPAQPAATRLTDVLDTRLDLRFDYARQYVLGTAVLTLRAHFFPQNSLVLDAKGFDIKSVQLVTAKGFKALTFKYNGRQLAIALGQTFPREQSYQVRVGYVARPNELPAGGSAAITAAKGLYFINPLGKEPGKPRQIWTQGETQSSSCWFPTIDQPNQRMTQEIALTVEDQFKTLSNGLLTASRKNPDGSRTDTWRQSLPAAPYLTMVAVGDFAVVTDSWRGKRVDYYVEPARKDLARAVFGHTPAMLDFFSKRLGVDYPWEKYAQVVVRDYVTGAMENTTATVHGTSIMPDSRRALLDVPYDGGESTIAHELFHHWFGDYVTAESWSNLPLNESFANYAQYLWAEHRYGPDVAGLVQQQDLASYLDEAEMKREPLIRYRYTDREEMFDRHSYEKGGRVLHMLRRYVGDEAFFAALTRYLTQNKLSAVEISHLRLAFEETTGEDLRWFFDQWFMRRGHPELKITHSYANGQVQLRVRQVQDTLAQPVFRLPVTVTVWQKDRPTEHRVMVDRADQTFTFLAVERPTLVKFDGESQLLAQLDEERSPEELLFQFYHARNYWQRTEVLDLLQNQTGELGVSSLMRNALNDSFYAIRRLALEHLRGYRGPNPAAVRADVQRLATADPNSAVRAQALTTLAAFSESYAPVFLAALRDSSYRVQAGAVAALARQPSPAARAPLAALESTPNSVLLTALAGYYAQRGGLDQYEWYLRRLPDVAEADLSDYLQAMGKFMTQLPVAERDKGIQTLTSLARTHAQYRVRLGAYHGLATLLPSQPGLKAVLADIKAKETDERLKAYYNLM